jgi:hypothetical protein
MDDLLDKSEVKGKDPSSVASNHHLPANESKPNGKEKKGEKSLPQELSFKSLTNVNADAANPILSYHHIISESEDAQVKEISDDEEGEFFQERKEEDEEAWEKQFMGSGGREGCENRFKL